MTEKKLAWIERRVLGVLRALELGPASTEFEVGALAHFDRRVAWMRETNGPSSNGERAEIDSMAEALGWTSGENR